LTAEVREKAIFVENDSDKTAINHDLEKTKKEELSPQRFIYRFNTPQNADVFFIARAE